MIEKRIVFKNRGHKFPMSEHMLVRYERIIILKICVTTVETFHEVHTETLVSSFV